MKKMRDRVEEYEDYLLQKSVPVIVPDGPDNPEDNENSTEILNFPKMYLIGEQILNFDAIRENNKCLQLYFEENQTDSLIRNFLEHLPTYDDEMLWKFSHQCEPDK